MSQNLEKLSVIKYVQYNNGELNLDNLFSRATKKLLEVKQRLLFGQLNIDEYFVRMANITGKKKSNVFF